MPSVAPSGASALLTDALAAPLEHLLVSLGSGIGKAQAALDQSSIAIQRLIDQDPVLAQYGLEATWYQIPSTQLELKVAVQLEAPSSAPARPLPSHAPRLWIQPVNARFQNQFSYDVQAASTISLSIVAVPPPGGATSREPRLTADGVLAIAEVRRHLFPADTSQPLEERVTVNFNPGAQAWYVLQTREEADGSTALRAFLRVDDVVGTVVEFRGGPA